MFDIRMKNSTLKRWWFALSMTWLAGTCSAMEPVTDLVKGGNLYATHCAECHSVKEGKNKKGPSLFAILGSPSGQRENFVYSDGMKSKPVIWSAETLSSYLANPKKAVPGGKMKFDGLESASERDDLIAYLASLSKPR